MKHPNPHILKYTRQRGLATLLTTVVMLIGITLLTVNASRISSLELIVSNNFETEKIAFNQSESVLDALLVVSQDVIDWNKPRNYAFCTPNDSRLGTCDENNIDSTVNWPSALVSNKHEGKIILQKVGCAPRWLDTSCAGTVQFAHYSLNAVFDDKLERGSNSVSVAGLLQPLF